MVVIKIQIFSLALFRIAVNMWGINTVQPPPFGQLPRTTLQTIPSITISQVLLFRAVMRLNLMFLTFPV